MKLSTLEAFVQSQEGGLGGTWPGLRSNTVCASGSFPAQGNTEQCWTEAPWGLSVPVWASPGAGAGPGTGSSVAVLPSSTGCRQHSLQCQRCSSVQQARAQQWNPCPGKADTLEIHPQLHSMFLSWNTLPIVFYSWLLYLVSGAFNPLLWPGQSPGYCNYKLRPE